jgi:hypothetical protein
MPCDCWCHHPQPEAVAATVSAADLDRLRLARDNAFRRASIPGAHGYQVDAFDKADAAYRAACRAAGERYVRP